MRGRVVLEFRVAGLRPNGGVGENTLSSQDSQFTRVIIDVSSEDMSRNVWMCV